MPTNVTYLLPEGGMGPVTGEGTPARDRLPARLSPSRAGDFTNCPLKFKLKTLDKLPDPGTWATAKGTLAHGCFERLFELPRDERTVEATLGFLDSEWHALVTADVADDADELTRQRAERSAAEYAALVPDPATWDKMRGEAAVCVRGYFRMEDPTRFDAHAIEIALAATIAGVPVHGIIDRLDRFDTPDGQEVYMVSDYKTGSPCSKSREAQAFFPMQVYALLVREVLGVVPTMLRLIYVREGHPSAIKTREVTPRLLAATERKLARIWAAMLEASEADVWPATPSNLCNFCPFQDRCPAYSDEAAA